MTTRDPSRFVPVSQASARLSGSALSIFLFLAAGALSAVGCGSDSSGGGQPFPEFEGTWAIAAGDDNSAITCPMEVGLDDVPFQIVNSIVTIQAGVLTDLVETDTLCHFGYNVAGKVATLPATDPYTGSASTCTISLSSSDGSNVVLVPSATPVWTFKLLAPEADKAPAAQIVGAAAATVMLADSNGNLQTLTPCTFAAQINLQKFAKP